MKQIAALTQRLRGLDIEADDENGNDDKMEVESGTKHPRQDNKDVGAASRQDHAYDDLAEPSAPDPSPSVYLRPLPYNPEAPTVPGVRPVVYPNISTVYENPAEMTKGQENKTSILHTAEVHTWSDEANSELENIASDTEAAKERIDNLKNQADTVYDQVELLDQRKHLMKEIEKELRFTQLLENKARERRRALQSMKAESVLRQSGRNDPTDKSIQLLIRRQIEALRNDYLSDNEDEEALEEESSSEYFDSRDGSSGHPKKVRGTPRRRNSPSSSSSSSSSSSHKKKNKKAKEEKELRDRVKQGHNISKKNDSRQFRGDGGGNGDPPDGDSSDSSLPHSFRRKGEKRRKRNFQVMKKIQMTV